VAMMIPRARRNGSFLCTPPLAAGAKGATPPPPARSRAARTAPRRVRHPVSARITGDDCPPPRSLLDRAPMTRGGADHARDAERDEEQPRHPAAIEAEPRPAGDRVGEPECDERRPEHER